MDDWWTAEEMGKEPVGLIDELGTCLYSVVMLKKVEILNNEYDEGIFGSDIWNKYTAQVALNFQTQKRESVWWLKLAFIISLGYCSMKVGLHCHQSFLELPMNVSNLCVTLASQTDNE